MSERNLTQDELGRIKETIEKRLIHAPSEAKRLLPRVLSERYVSYRAFATDTYFMLAFMDDKEEARIRELAEEGYHPFPGLITEDANSPAAFRFENSRNIMLESNTVTNMPTLSLGRDSSVVVANHLQQINTRELGPYTFVVQLAYVLSFGDKITRDNLHESLEDLVAYSINSWLSKPEASAHHE